MKCQCMHGWMDGCLFIRSMEIPTQNVCEDVENSTYKCIL